MKEKIAAMVQFEQSHREVLEHPARTHSVATSEGAKKAPGDASNEDMPDDRTIQSELATVISRAEQHARREFMRSQAGAPMDYRLDLPFPGDSDDESLEGYRKIEPMRRNSRRKYEENGGGVASRHWRQFIGQKSGLRGLSF